jgi:uncharacterized protein YigE (DUF2233 family)
MGARTHRWPGVLVLACAGATAVASAAGCNRGAVGGTQAARAREERASRDDRRPTGRLQGEVARTPGHTEVAPGLVVERVAFSLGAGSGTSPAQAPDDTLITLLRIDPARWDLRLLTAHTHGGSRSAPQWARAFQLTAVINASLYLPDQRSAGLMVDGDVVNNGRDNRRFGGFLAFHPQRDGLPAVRICGRDCAGFDLADLRASYATIVQSYRLLDCAGKPMTWKDEKRYGISAVAVDRRGWVVFVHCATPLGVREFNARLASDDLALASAIFVEGGRQACLYLAVGQHRLEEVGRREGEEAEPGGGPGIFWPVPNVIGVVARS